MTENTKCAGSGEGAAGGRPTRGRITMEPVTGWARHGEYLSLAGLEVMLFFAEEMYVQAFQASFIHTGYRPVLQVACARRDDIGPGKTAVLYVLDLEAMRAKFSTAAVLAFPEDWDGTWTVEDAAALAGILADSIRRAVPDEERNLLETGLETAAASWLPPQVRETLYGSLARELAVDAGRCCCRDRESQGRMFFVRSREVAALGLRC